MTYDQEEDGVIDPSGEFTADELERFGLVPGVPASFEYATRGGRTLDHHPYAVMRDDNAVATMVERFMASGRQLPFDAYDTMSAWEFDAWGIMAAASSAEEARRLREITPSGG